MPEGPEVTIMTNSLKKFKNSKLKNIIFGHKKFKSKITDLNEFEKDLPLEIQDIKNKGKFVYILLSNNWAIGFTLGMTGHFWIPEVSSEYKTFEGYTYNPKHNYVTLETTNGDFYFNDPRRFGHFYIYNNSNNKNNLESKLKTLGPDLIKDIPKMTQSKFNEHLSKFKPNKIIADVLLEQKFISGIGNYIRAEALYKAKISPLRTIGSLDNNDKKKLKDSLVKVSQKSYKVQKSGRLHEHKLKIYGNPDAKQTKLKGRTIWWDPKIQI
jgi:formamidopyrimidine-DNA glycosylase